MATRDLLEIAQRNADRAQQVLSNRQKREARRKAAADAAAEGLNVSEIAEKMGVSQETVRNDLKASGVYAPRSRAKVTPELRESIIASLKKGEEPGLAAEGHGVSVATARRIGVEEGLLEAGTKRTRRSDADFEELEKLEGDLRAIHGAGFSALGAALYGWQKRRLDKDAAEAEAPVAPETPAEAPPVEGDGEDIPW